jgi:hypothetical protein
MHFLGFALEMKAQQSVKTLGAIYLSRLKQLYYYLLLTSPHPTPRILGLFHFPKRVTE